MILFKKAADLGAYLSSKRTGGKRVGFVPTMGALHAGHISLINTARSENDITCSSIFVNPTQFNVKADFEKYPITIEKDIDALEAAGTDIVFLPSVDEVYPPGYRSPHYPLGFVETVLEGSSRPGHFQGVCQVVHRLLAIVGPERLYLGKKDYQQCMVIKKMIEITGIETEVRICPTLREIDGLAMSSRNMRLDENQRKIAPLIYKTLDMIRNEIEPGGTDILKQKAVRSLEDAGFNVDYVEIADAEDLRLIDNWDGSKKIVALCAAFIGDIRLIDNLVLNES